MTENPIITRPITTFKGRQLSVFYCFRELPDESNHRINLRESFM